MMNASTKSRPTTGRLARLWQRLVLPSHPASPGEVPAPPGASQGRVGATIAVAAVPSVASLVWTAWSLVDMIPAPLPVGLAAGVVLDIALVSSVAIAWIAPQVAKPAKVTGWLIAALAGLLVGFHAAMIMPILAGLGLIPLVSKGLWHLALNARLARAADEAAREAERLTREAEEAEAERLAEEQRAAREAELSTEPTHEEQRLVAQKRREAAHERELAEAEVELADAQAERDHRLELATIRRAAAQTREMEREDAETVKQRLNLIREIQAGRGLAIGSGEVPDDLSALNASPNAALMGFGSAMGADLRAPRGASPAAPVEIEQLSPDLRVLIEYIDTAPKASVRDAARALGCDPASIRRRREALTKLGHDMSAITPKK